MAIDKARFGTFGIWIRHSEATGEVANAVESRGFGTLWLGGSPPDDLTAAEELLASTGSLVVATGISNIWTTDPTRIAASADRLEQTYPGRFLLGVGVGHREATKEYRAPMAAMIEYLDALDAAGLGPDRRVLAALGPKMLELSRDRSIGAHPYLTTPEHTENARSVLGDEAFLAPEQKVVVDEDPARARQTARPYVDKPYLHLKNYTDNLKRLGFHDADFENGGSDELIDRLAFHGDAPAVASLLREHLRAGADHVAIQLLPGEEEWDSDLSALGAVLGNPVPN